MTTTEDTSCKLCNTPDSGFVYHYDDHMAGGYGSTRYDMRRLVWLKDAPEELDYDDGVCDLCVDRMVRDDLLEEIKNSGLSQKAFKNIFLMGARNMYAQYALERKVPQEALDLDENGVAAIERLRRSIFPDPSTHPQGALRLDENYGTSAYNTGKSHAVAAVMLGYACGESPDFSAAAAAYAENMVEHVQFIERLLGELNDAVELDKDD
ncbi:hypothetical protein [Sulfitobacter sp. R18_1]|uniref:hypothetical protein n=1 Tax=Sulfitobacter sp. R18_1 TaxID=2821104 RepID=UPI001ADC6040|nr:hypothetical protein [Sulfitobacter sp. R18_1]MBO9428691.1 hypothetical protein [Sulfitobacter sp. R18_1]